MVKTKCQVCGGPVSKGRCKYCGMPYRNDEELYHLNENRRDHYSHATEKAKQMMQQMEIPLGDKGSTRSNIKNKEEIKQQQQRVRQEAEKRIQNTKVPNTAGTTYKTKKTSSSAGKKKNNRISVWISIFIFILILLSSVWPNIVDYVKEKVRNNTNTEFVSDQDNVNSIFDEDILEKIEELDLNFDQ